MATVVRARDPVVAPLRGAGLCVLGVAASVVAWMCVAAHHGSPPAQDELVVPLSAFADLQQPTLITGSATYYADDFQGRIMASGAPFDVNDPSIAASNQWPLGTRLRLRRVPGGPHDASLTTKEREQYFNQATIVTVQDHGDFAHALDLSRAAFARLGRPSEGVIQILIEPLGTGTAAQPVTLAQH